MLSNSSRNDVVKDKASELVSAAADAAEAGRDKIAPVVENVAAHLSETADRVADAAAPHVAKAKDAVAEAAAKQADKAKQAAADASDAAAPQVARAKQAAADVSGKAKEAVSETASKQAKGKAADLASAAADAVDKASDAAAPHVATAKKRGKKAAKKTAKAAAPHVAKAKESTAEAAGLTADQARHLFDDELLPRIQEAVAAVGAAGGQAYAALPHQARAAVESVAPEVVKKRRKKGKLLIALGLIAGAGAVALIISGKRKKAAKQRAATMATLPEVERRDVQAAEQITGSAASDDAVGDLEKKVDATVSGSRRGRHAADE